MDATLNNGIALIAVLAASLFLFHPKIRQSPAWHATVTPLASIIGSGFLVSAPLLVMASGPWAVWVMVGIVLLAYALGASVRFNIQHLEPILDSNDEALWLRIVEKAAHLTLAVAYIISVAFYLKLLSAFVLHATHYASPFYENSMTSLILLFIGVAGKLRGLKVLETLETYSVSIKLTIIFALIVTMLLFNTELFVKGEWGLQATSHESGWVGLRQILGMLIIIQGFETSRFLGDNYSAAVRIKTMRYAQWISGVIYVVFIAVALVVFNDVQTISETTILDISGVVASVLPLMLVLASVMSQFSAAVADTLGSGGLLAETTRQRLSVNTGYLLIALVAVALTWLTNIYEVISIASKAFSLYYAFQLMLTIIFLKQNAGHARRNLLVLFYSSLLVVMLFAIVVGTPVE